MFVTSYSSKSYFFSWISRSNENKTRVVFAFVVVTLVGAVGWGCFQVGFGRKADPEPGRCRRTDGKKWRCSKEAYPESKYCERHMHRGRNRSRKHVEVIPSSSSSTTTAIPTATNTSPSVPAFTRNISMNTPTSSSCSYSFSPLSSSISPEFYAHQDPTQKSSHVNPFLYSHSSSSSSRPPGNCSGLSTHDNLTTHHLFLDSGSCSQPDKDYRFVLKINKTSSMFLFLLFMLFLPFEYGNIT